MDLEELDLKNLISEHEGKMILRKMLSSQNKTGSFVSHEILRNLKAVGNLGEYFDLNLKYNKENDDETKKQIKEKRLFIKAVPYKRPEMCQYIEESKILYKESKIYDKLLYKLREYSSNFWCLQSFYCRNDLLVLQNTLDLGYEPIDDVTRFFNKQEIEAVLKSLAAMHASSLAFENEHRLLLSQYVDDCLFEVPFSNKVAWYAANIKVIIALLKRNPLYQTEILQYVINKDLPHLFQSVLGMTRNCWHFCNVLCHRDIWGGNVFFSKRDLSKGAVFVDFQYCRYAPPAIDVLMTLFLNLKPSDRKPREEEYGKFYYKHFYEELYSVGLDPLKFMTYEDFNRSLVELAYFGVLYNCISATYLKSSLKNMNLNCPDDFDYIKSLDRTQEVMDLMKTNNEFKEHLEECLRDLMEFALKRNFGDKLP